MSINLEVLKVCTNFFSAIVQIYIPIGMLIETKSLLTSFSVFLIILISNIIRYKNSSSNSNTPKYYLMTQLIVIIISLLYLIMILSVVYNVKYGC